MQTTLADIGLKEINKSDGSGSDLYLIGGRRVASVHYRTRNNSGLTQTTFHIDTLIGDDLNEAQQIYLRSWRKRQMAFDLP